MAESGDKPKLNVAAAAWTPGGYSSSSTTNGSVAAAPAAAEVVSKMETLKVEDEEEEADGAEEVDENDPLWKVTLRLAEGDRKKAMRMLEDPDTLMKHPEVIKVIAASEAEEEEDDWENAAGDVTAGGGQPLGGGQPVVGGGGGLGNGVVAEADLKSVLPPSPPPPPPAAAAARPPPAAAAGGGGKKPAAKAAGGDDEEEDGEEEADEREEEEVSDEDPREHLNVVFIGHVDAGKSTLSGNILYLTDFVDKRTIERYEREAKQRNRESWFLAFIMDTNEEERAKGKTVEVGRAHFESATKRYTILDAPGHNAYVPNMIQGAAQADVGVLVISARRGEFETGFEKGGQTREHALLAKTLGIRHLVVVINKMDDPTVMWSKERFDECVSKLKPFLRGCGYAPKKDVQFIPISGLIGENVKDEVSPTVCPWWRGLVQAKENNTGSSTLLQLFDALHMDNRDSNASLRVPVLDRYVDRGTIVLGKVERGTLKVGSTILIMPTNQQAKVEAVFINDKKVRSAKCGENVAIKLSCSEAEVIKGFVLCDVVNPCKASKRFLCQLAIIELLDKRSLFTAGYDSVFHCHTVEEECIVAALIHVIDKKTGKPMKKVAFAKEGAMLVCVLEVQRSICVEKYDDMPAMGRLTLRTEGRTIAIGKIMQIKET